MQCQALSNLEIELLTMSHCDMLSITYLLIYLQLLILTSIQTRYTLNLCDNISLNYINMKIIINYDQIALYLNPKYSANKSGPFSYHAYIMSMICNKVK